jgi:hypothetical protein
MTNDAYRHQPLLRLVAAMIACFALAITTAGCSSEETSSETSASATSPSSPATVTTPPPQTVTITPPSAPPGVNIEPIAGPFQSPSGDIHCTSFISDGRNTVRCEVVDKRWEAPPRYTECELNWGDRVELTENSPGMFSCYGQNLPDPERTLDHGAVAIFGSISCTAEADGIMCLDNGTGHFFNVSRDAYQVG